MISFSHIQIHTCMRAFIYIYVIVLTCTNAYIRVHTYEIEKMRMKICGWG